MVYGRQRFQHFGMARSMWFDKGRETIAKATVDGVPSWVRCPLFLLSISLRLARLIRLERLLGRSLARYLFGLIFWRRLLRFCRIFVKIDREEAGHLSISLLKVSRKNQEAGVEGKEKETRPLFCASKRIKISDEGRKSIGWTFEDTVMSYDGSPVSFPLGKRREGSSNSTTKTRS